MYIGGPNPRCATTSRSAKPTSMPCAHALAIRRCWTSTTPYSSTPSPWPDACACNGARASPRRTREDRQTRQPGCVWADGPGNDRLADPPAAHARQERGFVGILDEAWTISIAAFSLQIDGSKTGLELPGIVDEVVTLAELKADDGASYRAFVCHTLNAWGYPAKDRSGRLDPIEEPHLGRLMEKIAGPARPATDRLDFARPAAAPVHPRTHVHSGVLIATYFDFNSAPNRPLST